MYYRIAIQIDEKSAWKWKSTVLSSLNTLFQFFRVYSALPHDAMLVFSSPSREELNELLKQENDGRLTSAVTVEQFLHERKLAIQSGQRARSVGEIQRQKTKSAITATLPPLENDSRDMELPSVERSRSWLEQKRYELELGAGSDHDQPYKFTLPVSMTQWLAWVRLQSKVRNEGLES